MKKDEILDIIEGGGVQFTAIIEIVGKPQSHVEQTMKGVIKSIENDDFFTLLSHEIQDAQRLEDTESLWSTIAEVEVITTVFSRVYDFCFQFMPASIEITEPEKRMLTSHEISTMITDHLGQLHKVDMDLKKINQQNLILQESLGKMAQNLVLISLTTGPKTLEELTQMTGVNQDQLPRVLDHLKTNNKLKKEGDVYSLP